MDKPARNSIAELRAKIISAEIIRDGIVVPVVVATISFFLLSGGGFPPPPGIVFWGAVELVCAAVPFLVLAMLVRLCASKSDSLKGAWIGALTLGLFVSGGLCLEIFYGLDNLAFSSISGVGELLLGGVPIAAMLLGGGLGWLIQRIVANLRSGALVSVPGSASNRVKT